MDYRLIPSKVFLTKGVGRHKDRLASFEAALRDAGIEKCNLIYVSSIFPPMCKLIKREEGLQLLKPGQLTPCVMARYDSNEKNRLIFSSVGFAQPYDHKNYGYVSEHHGSGQTNEEAGDYAEDLAATMLATTLDIQFDPEKDWDEREQLYKASGKIIRTTNITQSAEGKKDLWTTVLAAAVFPTLRTAEDLEEILNGNSNDF